MGTKYSSQATSGYNSSAPPDDGTQVAANLISWSMVKTKLADVLKTFGEAINTALVSTLDLSARAISVNDTAIASDHWKTLQVTGATTITLSSAASMGAGYEVGIFNAGASTVTITPGLASDTINNVSASVTIPIKGTMIFRTNQGLTGYNVVAQSNRMDAGAVDGTIIGGTTPAAGTFTTLGATGLITATGGQIAFPAAQVSSAGANVLDDYEEGLILAPVLTFGGASTGITYSGRTSQYTKVGKFVFLKGQLLLSSKGSSVGAAKVSIPLTADSTAFQGTVSWKNMTSSFVNIIIEVENTALTAAFFGATAAATSNRTALADTDFSNTSEIYYTVCYMASS